MAAVGAMAAAAMAQGAPGASKMRVRLGTELWLVAAADDGPPLLVLPTVRNRATGEGAPGIVDPAPLRVLRAGDIVEIAGGAWWSPSVDVTPVTWIGVEGDDGTCSRA